MLSVVKIDEQECCRAVKSNSPCQLLQEEAEFFRCLGAVHKADPPMILQSEVACKSDFLHTCHLPNITFSIFPSLQIKRASHSPLNGFDLIGFILKGFKF